ncbi:MAG: hypothetical protein ACP5RP_02695 [Candidatus Micrarchaeia archaeon]
MAENEANKTDYFIAYLLLLITGIIVYFISGEKDRKAKFHALQAIMLGIAQIIVIVFLSTIYLAIIGKVLSLLIWIYGIYIGIEAYNGNEVVVPYITEFAKEMAGIKSNDKGKINS